MSWFKRKPAALTERQKSNNHVRSVHEDAGNRDYPHENADGSVTWRRV